MDSIATLSSPPHHTGVPGPHLRKEADLDPGDGPPRPRARRSTSLQHDPPTRDAPPYLYQRHTHYNSLHLNHTPPNTPPATSFTTSSSGGSTSSSSSPSAASKVGEMMQLSRFIARFKSSSTSSPSSSSPSHSKSGGGAKSSRSERGEVLVQEKRFSLDSSQGSQGSNNNELDLEDFQISRESHAVQPKTGSVSTTSRSSMRSEQLTDDNSSISAKSDVSVDSLVFEANFGAIRPDLYPRKDIVLQQSSLDGGQGRLHTRLKYDFRTCDLVVHLIEAQDLPAPDPISGSFSDPYIRISLLPSVDERVRQSSVKRRTLNPYFNEYFKFPLDFDDVKDKTLLFHLYDYDKFSRHTPMGEVEISMANVNVSNSVEMWCDVQRQHKVAGESGEILLSLSYLPTAERLTVVVMKAKDLKLSTAAPSADPFVRVCLMVEGKKVKRKKTSVRRGSVNPVWNEGLAFNVPAEILPKVSLEVCVQDHDLLGHGELLGRCLLGGTDRPGEDQGHWKDMLTNQRKSVAMWHVLRK